MGAVVSFDIAAFRVRYPEFAAVSDALLTAYFSEATLYLANDGSGPVNDSGQQSLLLNMVVAHIAKLNLTVAVAGGVALANQGLVGNIASASEGSVSVSMQPLGSDASEMAAWFRQTPYGFSFWATTGRYRSFKYRPRAGRNFGINRGFN